MATPIEHVVVLMLENRSFDHLFGLSPGVEGIVGKGLSNALDPTAPDGEENPRFEAAAGATFAMERGQGPSHSLNGTNTQLFNDRFGAGAATLGGFVRNYADTLRHDRVGRPTPDELAAPMRCFSPGELPAIHALAQEFVLCDRWFSEVPGPTMPNRFYIHAATSAGYAHNDWKRTFDLRTIYNSLEDAGKTWAVYFSDEVELARFSQVNARRDAFRVFEERFADDARRGALPNYTFIVPRFAASPDGALPNNSMHAPQDVRPGDDLVADVYEALRADDAAWAKTLLVVTFDEHGGFYDHVVPPSAPSPDGLHSPAPGDPATFAPRFDFTRLGLRVPTILASPWLPKGFVDSTPYQHTSVLATLRELFGLGRALTHRDAAAASLLPLLGRLTSARDDTPRELPRAPQTEAALAGGPARPPGAEAADDTVLALVDGWDELLAAAPGLVTFEVLGPPLERPSTMVEAGRFIRASVLRYLDLRAAQAAEAAARPDPAPVDPEPDLDPEPDPVAPVVPVAPVDAIDEPEEDPVDVPRPSAPATVSVSVPLHVTVSLGVPVVRWGR